MFGGIGFDVVLRFISLWDEMQYNTSMQHRR